MISPSVSTMIGAGPMPDAKLPAGALAVATTIQSLALPIERPMR